MQKQIVVVDDEQDIADLIHLYLEQENYQIHVFYSATEAYRYMQKELVDLAIIDVMMPELDGYTLCDYLRQEGKRFPIMMLTAKDGEIDKVKGFSCGADDYITKPFYPLELVARVKAQLRRYTNYNERKPQENVYMIQGLMLDVEKHLCLVNERPCNLTPKEFAILALLCEHQGKVLSPDEIFRQVWKEEYYTSSNNTVMVHIRHIREKMKDDGEQPKYIKTIWGIGYKIEE